MFTNTMNLTLAAILEQFTESSAEVSPIASKENWTQTSYSCDQVVVRFVLYVCVFGVVCVLGFIGNIVSFLVLRKDGSSPVASFQLQVLAVSDNVLIFFWTNQFVVKYLLEYLGVDWVSLPRFFWYWRIYSYPFAFIAQTETIWLTVLIAVNRYIVVRMPLRAKSLCTIKNIVRQVIVVTVFSVAYNMPRFFEATPSSATNGTIYYYEPTWLSLNHDYQFVYSLVLYQLVTFALPLALLAFLNTSVMIAYRSAMKRRRMMSSRTTNENNITLVMIVVVLTFMVCQAPARIVQLIWKYQYDGCSFKFYLVHISIILEALNSSINFVLYFWFRKRFRLILWQSYCGRSPEMPAVHRWLEEGYSGKTSPYSSLRRFSDELRMNGSKEVRTISKNSPQNGVKANRGFAGNSAPPEQEQSLLKTTV